MRLVPFRSAALLVAFLALAALHDTARAQSPTNGAEPGEGPPAAPDSVRLATPAMVLERGGLLRSDRLRHLSLSFALGLGVGVAGDSPWSGAGVSGAIGLLKEIDDGRRGRRFDRTDLLADLVGAGLAGLAASALRR